MHTHKNKKQHSKVWEERPTTTTKKKPCTHTKTKSTTKQTRKATASSALLPCSLLGHQPAPATLHSSLGLLYPYNTRARIYSSSAAASSPALALALSSVLPSPALSLVSAGC